MCRTKIDILHRSCDHILSLDVIRAQQSGMDNYHKMCADYMLDDICTSQRTTISKRVNQFTVNKNCNAAQKITRVCLPAGTFIHTKYSSV